MKRIYGLMVGAALLAATACNHSPTGQNAQPAAAPQIAWREGDVNDAFAEAKEQNKPVLLYWGAKWCPPCNQMKQTLFKDAAFIAETRAFIPVHLDGDAKDAQLWGEKFGIAGYPTVIVLRPDHTEVTRLSGSSAAPQLARCSRRRRRAPPRPRTCCAAPTIRRSSRADDWRLLASFDWGDDPKHFADPGKRRPS